MTEPHVHLYDQKNPPTSPGEIRRLTHSARIGAVVNERKVTVGELRTVFESVQNPTDWKQATEGFVAREDVALVIAAVEFFHADTPEICGVQVPGMVHLMGRGYQAW